MDSQSTNKSFIKFVKNHIYSVSMSHVLS